jgi:predicted membrane channel-forming protein YqfA (hemolysin III family)
MRSQTDSTCLYCYHEIPTFLQGNPYVKSGYRVYLSTKACLRRLDLLLDEILRAATAAADHERLLCSLFWLSNESVNVWSHLIMFLYFVVACIWMNTVVIPEVLSTWWDHVIFTLYLTCFQVSMGCSACYHLFNCCGADTYTWWLRVDLFGVTLAICGCYIPGVYYAFFCHQVNRGQTDRK